MLPSSPSEDVAKSIESIPSESIAINEKSLLKPAHERDEPALMHDNEPLEIVRDEIASYSI